jgi:hypothetical protein|tara:strand:+ start:88 stop:576 length:489 start_codon:yes stop_codon:yes gene_type:complete
MPNKFKTIEERNLHNQKMKLYMRKYRSTEKGYKKSIISKWQHTYGLIGDYDAIFERYMTTTHCDLCNILLTKERIGGRNKQMEHNHSTGEFRNIVCHICNSQKTDKKKASNNKSGYKNVAWNPAHNNWLFRKNWDGKRIAIERKSKIEILCIKFASIILWRK